ncbi:MULTISPECIES: DUF4411 family protein [unclassified Duganella]|uniref:DUF4411 family protein n=1 Tax=unclassified Duganella TaxID=2636909 RepID=UPI000E34F99E|nr:MULTISPECIES: DUF4411 family protein [unclassified Duganella]RFP10844.1 DUF4411 family protein [Duganella sp. BJB475]RFP27128.1 DUF4411 family protein [Duganella sp. BJB476]
MRYLLDANTFVEAKNRYYNMTVCPAYWEWILQKFGSNDVASISMIGDELKRGDDELASWVRCHPALFEAVDDESTQACFVKVVEFVASETHRMKVGAVEDFLSGADPWLIAKAMATGATVVTHERHHADVVKKFLIPNVCDVFNVEWMNTFDLLYKLEARFVLPGG